MIIELDEETDKMTYDRDSYKLYLVPEKDSGSPMALLMGEALPSNYIYAPAETHTYYAIADLREWSKEDSGVYVCAVRFVNCYDKQEHKTDAVKAGPQLNRVLERVSAKESKLLSRSITLTFPDNNPGDWYCIAIQEASNSHEHQRSVHETTGDETWIKLIENVDWKKSDK